VADRVPLDFDPPVRQLRALLLGITDADLDAPTPCTEWTLGDLLDHIMNFTYAFTQAARKLGDGPSPGRASRANLPKHWRSRLPVQLEDLSTAWKEPAAWAGTAAAGRITMPAAAMGTQAMNELTLHSWDVARATGQDFAADPRTLEVLIEAMSQGTPGGFAPPVDLSESSLLAQAVALSGRDPRWRPRPSSRSTSAAA